MESTLLVVNCGSSSLKLAIYTLPEYRIQAAAVAERLNSGEAILRLKAPTESTQILEQDDHRTAIRSALALFARAGVLDAQPDGIGHRVVHGGEAFTGSVLITEAVQNSIESCASLAPLHNPANLEGIRILQELYPEVPQVAVFDTAFHQTLPRQAYLYALPYSLYQTHGVRRYGFHGTSHRFMLTQAASRLGKEEFQTSLISAHLGNGCSITAIRNGQSVDTSMGLTPLEGLVMGTRSGDIDPGLFDFFLNKGWAPQEINRMLNRDSGLQGVSGLSNDMRTLVEAANEGNDQADLAVDVFCFRLARYIGAMMASLEDLDALVFTGGIGENSAAVRSRTLKQLSLLGFHLDEKANADHGRSTQGAIHARDGHTVLVIPTDEERVIASDTAQLIASVNH